MSFRSARKKRGISALEAAEKLGVTDAAIYQWECGISLPTAKRLPEIAKLYGCTIDELLEKDKEEQHGKEIHFDR